MSSMIDQRQYWSSLLCLGLFELRPTVDWQLVIITHHAVVVLLLLLELVEQLSDEPRMLEEAPTELVLKELLQLDVLPGPCTLGVLPPANKGFSGRSIVVTVTANSIDITGIAECY
jgi:hypothetical protein